MFFPVCYLLSSILVFLYILFDIALSGSKKYKYYSYYHEFAHECRESERVLYAFISFFACVLSPLVITLFVLNKIGKLVETVLVNIGRFLDNIDIKRRLHE